MEKVIDITLSSEELEGSAAKILSWVVDVGEAVVEGDPLLELETDKVTMEICAPATGRLQGIDKFPGDEVEPNDVLGKIVVEAVLDGMEKPQAKEMLSAQGSGRIACEEKTNLLDGDNDNSARHLVGPAVRLLLRENMLDITRVPGTGRQGRVTRNDVQGFLQAQTSTSNKIPGALKSTKVPHSPMRKAIAKHMVSSLLETSPHVTSVFEMDMANVIEHRRWHKKEFSDQGVKLTFTAYFLSATVKAMHKVPQINARYHEDALELFADINIGVGTALGEDGLVVPVVQQVQNKNLFEISRALHLQTGKARSGKLTFADMKNGTFTISNHGVSGSLFAAPIIINQPQVAILGIGKLEKRVVVTEVNGEDCMEIRPRCYVSLSIDHRAVDAFQTNRFLSEFVETINNWGN